MKLGRSPVKLAWLVIWLVIAIRLFQEWLITKAMDKLDVKVPTSQVTVIGGPFRLYKTR